MRLLSVLITLGLMFSLFANEDLHKDIVTGAYSALGSAQSQNKALEAKLGGYPVVAEMMQQKQFYFDVKYYRGLYRAVITHFSNPDVMLTVLNTAKRHAPDAYVTSSTPSLIPPTPTASAQTYAAPKASAVTPPRENTPAPKPLQPPKPARIEPIVPVVEEEYKDITVIDEPEAPPSAAPAQTEPPAPTAETIKPAVEEAPEPIAPTATAQTASESSRDLLTYGIVGAGALLLLLLLFAMRKSRKENPLGTPKNIDLSPIVTDTTQESTPEPEPSAPITQTWPEQSTTETEEIVETVFTPEPLETPEPQVLEPGPQIAEPEPPSEAVEPPAPIATPRKKREAPALAKAVSKEDLAAFAGNRILVAEDNLINQKVISKLFEGSGIEIAIANNGQEALDILGNDPGYNMVLMDAHMPVMDGFEATRQIRHNLLFEPIVVVALSGDVGGDDIRKMKEAGMEEQLAKPLRVEALYNVLYQYLDLEGEAPREEETPLEPAADFGERALNKAEGLEICNGDKTMYLEILEDFVRAYGESVAEINGYIRANDHIKLVALLLDIKGVAANIGADPLSKSAETFRKAVLINRIESYDMLCEAYGKELRRLLGAIDSFMKSAA